MIGFEISKRNNDLSYNLYLIYYINDATTCLKFQNSIEILKFQKVIMICHNIYDINDAMTHYKF